MASPKQARGQGPAGRGTGTGAGAKKSTTRGGRPDVQPSGGAAGGSSGGQARRANGGPQRPSGGSQAQRDKGRPRPVQARSAAAASGIDPVVADGPLRAPRWLQITTLVLSLIGLADSVYLTIAHYTSSNILACSDKGVINCAKVTTSPESIVFGIPVAVLGLAFFVFMVAVSTHWAWRAKFPVIHWARLASVIVGIGFVLYLVYTEVVTLGNICLFCTYAHVVTFALFGLIVFSATAGYGLKPAGGQRPQPRR